MATGSDTYKGLAVPLLGDFQIRQRTAATDVMTITGASSQSGDFIVCESSTGTEYFVVNSSGVIDFQGATMTTGQLDLSGGGELVLQFEVATTAPSTGMTTGALFVYTAGNIAYLGVPANDGTLWKVAMTDN
jgi:hypothetical protein